MNHTKGEWIINKGISYNFIKSDTKLIAMIDSLDGTALIEHEANAKFIAQSPIMFDYIQGKANNGCKKAKEIVANVLNN